MLRWAQSISALQLKKKKVAERQDKTRSLSLSNLVSKKWTTVEKSNQRSVIVKRLYATAAPNLIM